MFQFAIFQVYGLVVNTIIILHCYHAAVQPSSMGVESNMNKSFNLYNIDQNQTYNVDILQNSVCVYM